MKRFLSLILTLMLVFTIGTSVVMADEYVEAMIADAELNGTSAEDLAEIFAMYGLTLDTENMQIIDPSTGAALTKEEVNTVIASGQSGSAASTEPTEEDFLSERNYMVYDFSDSENITYIQYKVGTDMLLGYVKNYYYSYYGEEWEETEYEGKKAIMKSQTIAADELAEVGIAHSEEDGFFAKNKVYAIAQSAYENVGFDSGTVIGEVVFVFGENDKEVKEIKVGENNSLVVTRTEINWVNVLIVAMCFVVLVLIIVTVIVAVLSKKKAKKQNSLKDSKYVSEDEVFGELVEEAGIEVYEDEEIEEVEEIEEADIPEIEVIEKDEAEETEEEDK